MRAAWYELANCGKIITFLCIGTGISIITWVIILNNYSPQAREYINNSRHLAENMLGYLSADIICSEKRTVFRERSSRKTVSFEEQIMSKDKYPSIFSPLMEAIVFIILQIFFATRNIFKIGEYLTIIPWARVGYLTIILRARGGYINNSRHLARKYIEDITRWREDMNFIFEWQNNILRTSAASE